MTLIKFFFTFFALLGLTSYFFSLFLKYSNENSKEIKNYSFSFLYLTSSWLLSVAYFGLISVYFFYFNLPNYYSIYFSFITTFIIIIFNYKSFNIFLKYLIKYLLLIKKITLQEKFLLLILLLVIINSSFRIFVNWNDQDEIDVYGYTTKLIYKNYLITDGVFDRFPLIFSEAMSSSFYWVTENNFFPKFIRLISLIFISLSILTICIILNIGIFYSLVGSILFFLTPELALIGTSMKVESILIPYELMGLLLFFLAINNIIKYHYNESNNSINSTLILDLRSIKLLLFISFFFLVLSFNIKLSGVYSLSLSILTLLTLIFLWKNSFKKKIKYISILFIIIFFCSPLYIYNFYIFLNPFFPIDGPWLKLFTDSQYDLMAFNYEYYKKIGNIVSPFPLIKHLIILPYHSLGLENFNFDFNGIIAKPDVAISGWINPITLIIFLSPLFFFRSLEIFLLFIIFFILYLFWVNGIQYSRVFIAASSLNIIIALKIISLQQINVFDTIIKVLIKLYIICIIFFLLSYHVMTNNNYSAYGYKTFFNEDIKNKLTILKSTKPENWKKYKVDKKSFNDEFNNYQEIFINEDINEINNILNSINRPLIIEEIENISFIHLLFDTGFFIDSDKYSTNSNSQNFYRNIITKFLLKNKNVCIIYKEKYNNYLKLDNISFSSLKYHSENDIYVKCTK